MTVQSVGSIVGSTTRVIDLPPLVRSINRRRPGWPACGLGLKPISGQDAHEIVSWRYPETFAIYDLEPKAGGTRLDPASGYIGIHRSGRLIGYVCLGAEGRVPGREANDAVDDLGLGISPELTRRGSARTLLPDLMAAVWPRVKRPTVRVVIPTWNLRAQAAARREGFVTVGEVENDGDR